MSTAGYEFTAQQNETFKGLVSVMRRSATVVAIASFTLLAHQFVDFFSLGRGATPPAAIGYLDLTVWCLLALVGVMVAALLVQATSAFTAVIHTEGKDIEHLMQWLARVHGILKLIFVAAAVAATLLGVSFALLLIY